MSKTATYEEIQAFVKSKYGFVPKTCWIAHVKEICGLPLGQAWNRSDKRTNPCPKEKIDIIKEAFKHFNMI